MNAFEAVIRVIETGCYVALSKFALERSLAASSPNDHDARVHNIEAQRYWALLDGYQAQLASVGYKFDAEKGLVAS